MERPIFVVGCPRSGTTLVNRMLDQHSSISCGSESFVLERLYQIEKRTWVELQHLGVTQVQWRNHVRDLFSWIHEQRAESKGKGRWADKTPTYALILDYIDDLYPDCQVLHVIRDPRDVIDSWRRRVGTLAAREAVRAWPTHVEAARAFGRGKSPERYFEIRYEELVVQPEKVMSSVISWLGEPWEGQILQLPPRKRSKPQTPEQRERRKRARWLGQPVEEPQIQTQQDPQAEVRSSDAPSDPRRWAIQAPPATIVATSVGTGSRGTNFLINAPFLLELERVAGPLVGELGYDRPFRKLLRR
jgi:Sulfotransferase family